jgi:predicted ATPase
MQRWLAKALGGERQVVFITGETGIGKTTVVEAFAEKTRAEKIRANDGLRIGRGQCIEYYGAGEAYMPVLEALTRLCRESEGERLVDLLDQYAPTWLVQMSSLLSAAELESLQRQVMGATRERMMREMAEAVEALTAERPLVLVLEDLQWSDYPTLELLSFLARRREQARLLLIGTYRPVEVMMNSHPLEAVKQELQIHGQCQEMPLGFLTEAAVAKYLATRFPGSQLPAGLARLIHQRTDGNPLFMVNVVDYLLAQSLITQIDGRQEIKVGLEEVEVGVPENLRQMIEKQIGRLSLEEQRVLEVGSVAGMEFSAAAVAAGLEEEVVKVEERCKGLVRRGQFLRSRGVSEWSDGTVAARYGFIHSLYQEVLYQGVTAAQRVRLHCRIGQREEEGYGDRVGEIAAELAVHFEQGRDYQRAVKHLGQAAENALRRSAYREAINHLTKALQLLKTLPDTPERTQQELLLQTTLGQALEATKGSAAPEVERVYTRALQLCQQMGDTPQLFPVLVGFFDVYFVRGELPTAHQLAEQLLTLAQSGQDPVSLMGAHAVLGATLSWVGELVPARAHLEQSLALCGPENHLPARISCLSNTAHVLWLLGYPDQALKRSQEALALAQEMSHPFFLAWALNTAAVIHLLRGEGKATQEQVEVGITLYTEQEFTSFLAMATVLRGWALAEQAYLSGRQGQVKEGMTRMRRGMAAWRATGIELIRPHFLALLAEAYGKVGQVEKGLTLLLEALALVHKTGQHVYEAELYRLKGELLGQRAKTEAEAETCFHQAIDTARRQGAKSWELRAVMSLNRLWQRQGKKEEARQKLAEIYGWFAEGFDTADLQEARALLEEVL